MRGNLAGELALFICAVGMFDTHRLAGALGDGVENADANAIALEVRVRFAAERELDPTAGIARHGASPSVIDRPALAVRVEFDSEGVLAHFPDPDGNPGQHS